MVTELEEQFFKVFGIEPEFGYWCRRFDETNIADCNGIKEPSNKCAKCENGYIKYKVYPEITAEKLLQMICIAFNPFQSFEINRRYTVETLKDKILSLLILAKDDVYNQVQQLFKKEG